MCSVRLTAESTKSRGQAQDHTVLAQKYHVCATRAGCTGTRTYSNLLELDPDPEKVSLNLLRQTRPVGMGEEVKGGWNGDKESLYSFQLHVIYYYRATLKMAPPVLEK